MIVVDSSVWIDFFNGSATPQTDRLDGLLGRQPLLVGDLILAEVLQGFRHSRDFDTAHRLMTAFSIIDIGGADIAVQSARNFRRLRAAGVSVRKTIDCLLATRCIEDGHALLFSDRDFTPFVEHLGLEAA